MTHVIAISGGKDSTAMALRLAELHPEREYTYLITPTDDELPPMVEHLRSIGALLGKPLTTVDAPTLRQLIDEQKALPNWRMRWCTRMIKIEPCIEYLRGVSDPVLYVGLRADEPDRKGGAYSEEVENVFPLREWGWGIDDVLGYLQERGVTIPERTDCARCPFQRLGEWWMLWREYPEIYQSAVGDETMTGHTYRSKNKDKHPASLAGLREKFEAGWIPRGTRTQHDIFACAVCRK